MAACLACDGGPTAAGRGGGGSPHRVNTLSIQHALSTRRPIESDRQSVAKIIVGDRRRHLPRSTLATSPPGHFPALPSRRDLPQDLRSALTATRGQQCAALLLNREFASHSHPASCLSANLAAPIGPRRNVHGGPAACGDDPEEGLPHTPPSEHDATPPPRPRCPRSRPRQRPRPCMGSVLRAPSAQST